MEDKILKEQEEIAKMVETVINMKCENFACDIKTQNYKIHIRIEKDKSKNSILTR